MGHARCSFTCLISLITSERAEVLYSALSTPDQVMEGEQGWVMQGVLSRASFR